MPEERSEEETQKRPRADIKEAKRRHKRGEEETLD
jgi:hypothetical protein